MVDKKKLSKQIFYGVAILVVLSLALVLINGAVVNAGTPDEIKSNPRKVVRCDVVITNPVGDQRIESVNCRLAEPCGIFSIVPSAVAGVFSDTGVLRLIGDDISVSKSVKTSEFSSESVLLEMCTRDRSFDLTFVGENVNELKAVNV